MGILIFILVLVALIVVHEFGHFVVAKLSGMRVDEFGIGYPPRALTFATKGDTIYTLNWLPFGGFVRIYGEDVEDPSIVSSDTHRAFSSRPRILQALVLLAGIAMNLFFAYVLLTMTLWIGIPRELTQADMSQAKEINLMTANVLPGSPADEAKIVPGDVIESASFGANTWSGHDEDAFSGFIASDSALLPITLSIRHNGAVHTVTTAPRTGLIKSEPLRPALGVGVAVTGIVPLAWYKAPLEGAKLTYDVTKETAVGLWHFFSGIATLTADLSQVSGPIGIAGVVGNASSQGITSLLYITALISINLALINIIPLPALDGGRLLFVIVEAITRRPIPAVVSQTLNMAGFALLILLMVVVSAHDVFKMFS